MCYLFSFPKMILNGLSLKKKKKKGEHKYINGKRKLSD